jgi:glutamine synthetase
MKLDRNIKANDGRGKYAILLLRKLALYQGDQPFAVSEVEKAIETLERAGIIDWGIVGTESEFFLTRLKDQYAAPSLHAYADAAEKDDPEWAGEVRELARRAEVSPWQQKPD